MILFGVAMLGVSFLLRPIDAFDRGLTWGVRVAGLVALVEAGLGLIFGGRP